MKMKWYINRSVFLAGIVTLTLRSSIFSDSIPGIKTFAPEKSSWCWVAVCECLVKYWDPSCTKTQADIASVLTTQNIVPEPDSLPRCLIENGKKVNLQVDYIKATIPWKDVKKEADDKRPFLFFIRLNSGGYHCNAFAGYIGDSTKLKFMEPSEGGSGSFVYRTWTSLFDLPQNKGKWERTIKTNAGTTYINNSSFSNNNLKIMPNRMLHSGKGVTFMFNGNLQVLRALRIYNALGKCVYESCVDGNVTQLSWDNTVSSGMYYVLYGYKNRDHLSVVNKSSFSVLK